MSHIDSRICLLCALARGRAHLRDCEHLGTLQTRKIPHDVWSPIAVTDYAEIHDVFTAFKLLVRVHIG